MCFLVSVYSIKTPKAQSFQSAPFGFRIFYSTTIAVLDGSPSPALLTAMMRYSSFLPRGCSTKVAMSASAIGNRTICLTPLKQTTYIHFSSLAGIIDRLLCHKVSLLCHRVSLLYHRSRLLCHRVSLLYHRLRLLHHVVNLLCHRSRLQCQNVKLICKSTKPPSRYCWAHLRLARNDRPSHIAHIFYYHKFLYYELN